MNLTEYHKLPKGKKGRPKTKDVDDFSLVIRKLHHLPVPDREFRFDETRRWRFDYAWPEYMVACEKEGGVYSMGRHTRVSGYVKDLEKYNSATEQGWRVLRYPTGKIDYEQIRRVLG